MKNSCARNFSSVASMVMVRVSKLTTLPHAKRLKIKIIKIYTNHEIINYNIATRDARVSMQHMNSCILNYLLDRFLIVSSLK